MPVLKVKNNGVWETVGSVSNANTLDGKPASYFAAYSDVNELQLNVDEMSNIDYDTYLAFDTSEIV